MSTMSGRTYCWHTVANVCRREYCVIPSPIIFLNTRFMLLVMPGFVTELKFIFPRIIFDTGIFLSPAKRTEEKRRGVLQKTTGYAGGEKKSFSFKRCKFTKKLLCAKLYAGWQPHTRKEQRRTLL